MILTPKKDSKASLVAFYKSLLVYLPTYLFEIKVEPKVEMRVGVGLKEESQEKALEVEAKEQLLLIEAPKGLTASSLSAGFIETFR